MISKSGRQTIIQITDKNYFEYSRDNALGGATKNYKYNAVQEITINLQKNTASITSLERDNSSFQQIDDYEYSKVSDFFNWVGRQFKSGDNSNKEQYGWRLYGVGHDMEWQKGLPKPKEGSDPDGIDIGILLKTTMTISPNATPAEMYREITSKLMKKTGKDMASLFTALNIMTQSIESSVDALEIMKETTEKLKPEDNSTNLEPGKKAKGSAYCPFCQTNFKDSSNTWVPTKGSVKDTMKESHYTPVNKTPIKNKRN